MESAPMQLNPATHGVRVICNQNRTDRSRGNYKRSGATGFIRTLTSYS